MTNPLLGVKKYKLLVMWQDDNMKWATNSEFIIIKEAKRLHFLRILNNYGLIDKFTANLIY